MDAMTRQGGDVSHRRELAAQDPLRFDQTSRLLHHRVSLGIGGPLSEIAHACGSRDDRPFALEMQRRFGHAARAYAERHVGAIDGTVPAGTSVSASWARAV